MSYAYMRTITITGSSTLLPSTQTDFPVLVKLDSVNCGTTLKLVANGGHIQNHGNSASGPVVDMPYDLIFTSDSGGTTLIPWEVESYDGTNGILWAWVKIASCALSGVFYVFYDDASVNSAQNIGSYIPANVWDSNYKGVWHLNVTGESTSAGYTLTAVNTPTTTTGEIDGAYNFVAASQQYLTNASSPISTAYPTTISAWVKLTSATLANNTDEVIASIGKSTTIEHLWVAYFADGTGTKFIRTVANSASGGGAYYKTFAVTLDTNWHHIVGIFTNSSTQSLYLDGVSLSVAGTTGTAKTPSGMTNMYIGDFVYNTSTTYVGTMNGNIDEVRVSDVVRSTDWIVASYNASSDPQTFAAVGSETPLTVSGLVGVIIQQIGNSVRFLGGR